MARKAILGKVPIKKKKKKIDFKSTENFYFNPALKSHVTPRPASSLRQLSRNPGVRAADGSVLW